MYREVQKLLAGLGLLLPQPSKLTEEVTMERQLTGKTALVTGGSRGIGAAIAKRLAANGATVALSYAASSDRAAEIVKEIEDQGGTAFALQADQADPTAAGALISRSYERLGRLDILVNNAGVTVQGRIDDPDADQAALDRQFAINVTSVAVAVRAAARLLSDGGRIISIGSVFGARSPWAGIGGYSATKAALGGYTRGWARDLGPRGITVNLVQPGAINTELNPETADHAAGLVAMTSLGRYGQPDEIAAVVAFLAGPDASYITGATVDVDGGHLA
jgi:3-oxoacyl-[acyl-carrier protein] reductase